MTLLFKHPFFTTKIVHLWLFKYPCSYLIYSSAFESLEPNLRAEIYQHLWDVLSGKVIDSKFDHLDQNDRRAILEILSNTKSDLPDYWRSPAED